MQKDSKKDAIVEPKVGGKVKFSQKVINLQPSIAVNVQGAMDLIFSRMSRSWYCSLISLYSEKTFLMV